MMRMELISVRLGIRCSVLLARCIRAAGLVGQDRARAGLTYVLVGGGGAGCLSRGFEPMARGVGVSQRGANIGAGEIIADIEQWGASCCLASA